MFKRASIVAAFVGAAAVAFMAMAPAASAATPPAGATPAAVVAWRGVVTGHGTGIAAFKGLMDLHASADDAFLLVKDPNGDAAVDVDGYGGKGVWNGVTVYWGFHGHAHIVGRDVGVMIIGRDIDFSVVGRGWAFLRGHGTYRVNGGPPQPWTDAGERLNVAP
jgi:hypothetical protein